jgi:MraZ protein
MASNYGTYRYAVDHKGRLSIPREWRGGGKRFFLRPSDDGYLQLFGEAEWQVIEDKLKVAMRKGRDHINRARKYIQDATWVSVDTQGRITIPSALLSRAGLGKEAVLHGNIEIIEIWSPERFQIQSEQASAMSEADLLRD